MAPTERARPWHILLGQMLVGAIYGGAVVAVTTALDLDFWPSLLAAAVVGLVGGLVTIVGVRFYRRRRR